MNTRLPFLILDMAVSAFTTLSGYAFFRSIPILPILTFTT
jgi:hypothetical protein